MAKAHKSPHGKPSRAGYTHPPKVQLEFSEEILHQLNFMAEKELRSRKNLMEYIIIRYVEQYPNKAPQGWKPTEPIYRVLKH